MNADESSVYPDEAMSLPPDDDGLNESRGVINGLLAGLAGWAVLLVAVGSFAALVRG